MPGPEFFQTRMGHMFFEQTMPEIARALKRIADAMTVPRAEPCSIAAISAAGGGFAFVLDNCDDASDPLFTVFDTASACRVGFRELLSKDDIAYWDGIHKWSGVDDVIIGQYRIRIRAVSR